MRRTGPDEPVRALPGLLRSSFLPSSHAVVRSSSTFLCLYFTEMNLIQILPLTEEGFVEYIHFFRGTDQDRLRAKFLRFLKNGIYQLTWILMALTTVFNLFPIRTCTDFRIGTFVFRPTSKTAHVLCGRIW